MYIIQKSITGGINPDIRFFLCIIRLLYKKIVTSSLLSKMQKDDTEIRLELLPPLTLSCGKKKAARITKDYWCHHCGRHLAESRAVKCRGMKCTLCFCRQCLVRYYKYSKSAAKVLPSATWRCPKCTCKCMCGMFDFE